MNKYINLLNEYNLKCIIFNKANIRQVEYLLITFLNLFKEKRTNNLEMNHSIELIKSRLDSDIIIKYDNNIIKIRLYNSINNEFIMHFLINNLKNNVKNLVELKFSKNINKMSKIIEICNINNIENDKDINVNNLSNILKIINIDTNNVNKLDNSSAMNRWIKFISAKTNEERIKACQDDLLLTELYNHIINE